MMLEGLEDRLGSLNALLAEEGVRYWTAEQGTSSAALQNIQQALSTLDFANEDAVSVSPPTPPRPPIQAVVEATSSIMNSVEAVNQAKRMLQTAFKEFKNEYVVLEGRRKPLAVAILRDLGRATLDRQTAYRQLFCFDTVPDNIGFSRSYVRPVARKTQLQVTQWLAKRDEEGTESFRNTVASLHPDEPLAMVKARYFSQRVNVYKDSESQMVPAHLPLFFPPATLTKATVRPSTRALEAPNGPRENTRLEERPLFVLGATRVYRYKEECR